MRSISNKSPEREEQIKVDNSNLVIIEQWQTREHAINHGIVAELL